MSRKGIFVVALVLAGCRGASEDDCKRACERPFDITLQEGQVRTSAWKRMPAPLAAQAAQAATRWEEAVRSARALRVAPCVDACKGSKDVGAVQCRARAGNVGEWRRCGGG